MLDESDELTIDKLALDDACTDQSRLYFYWSRKKAVAKDRVNRLKRKASIARSQAQKDVRERPDAYGLHVVSEAAFKAAVEMHELVRKTMREQIEAESDLEDAESMIEALNDRRRMLTLLVDLLKIEYWDSKNATANDTRAAEDNLQDRREAIRERARRKGSV